MIFLFPFAASSVSWGGFSFIDFQQNILYFNALYVCVPIPPLLDPIWLNQHYYKGELYSHPHTHIHTYTHAHSGTLCELIGWTSHRSLRGLQLNWAIIRVWMAVGEGSTSPLLLGLSPPCEPRSCSSDNSAVDLCYSVSTTLRELTWHQLCAEQHKKTHTH